MFVAYFKGRVFLGSCLSQRLHVYYSSYDGPAAGVFDTFAHSKVCDFDFTPGVEEDILWLDVPVDGMALGVNIVQPFQNLLKTRPTLLMIVAIYVSLRVKSGRMSTLSDPMSINSMTCLTRPLWKKQL